MSLVLSQQQLQQTFMLRHGPRENQGWSPRMKSDWGYFSPDVYYEAMVAQLATENTCWLDLGCGSDIFPSNKPLAEQLANRVARLVGVDPSENILKNQLIHEKFQGTLDNFPNRTFDLITLRMVAEHIADPPTLVRHITRLTHPGSRVVIYTVNLWSVVTALSAVVPFQLHHPIKHLFWRTQEEDTFPVVYRMNTRKQLRDLFASSFDEQSYHLLSDCRTLARWRVSHLFEMVAWKMLTACGIPYPENCILAVFVRR